MKKGEMGKKKSARWIICPPNRCIPPPPAMYTPTQKIISQQSPKTFSILSCKKAHDYDISEIEFGFD